MKVVKGSSFLIAVAVLSVCASLLCLPKASAQEAATPTTQVESGDHPVGEQIGLPPEAELSSVEEELYFADDEMVTGATKREVPLAEAPANIFVITNEDIVQSGQTNLAEVLRLVPGMDAIYISSGETQVSMRGFAQPILYGTRMAVLIDGRKFYHEFISGTVWGEIPVPLDDIKRIEVIKGPMSALHGNKALLGIINIITYDPDETRTKLEGGGGSYWMGKGDFTHAGNFDADEKYWYKVTGHYIRYNDYTNWRVTGKQKAEEDFAATGKFLAKPIDGMRAQLNAGASQTYGLAQFAALFRGDDRRVFVDGNFDQDFGRWGKLAIKSYWERAYLKVPDLPAIGTLVVDDVESEARHTISFEVTDGIQNTLTYGFDFCLGDIDNLAVRKLYTIAGYLQDEFRFYDKLILTGGARFDYQKTFVGHNVAAHGSLVWLAHPVYTFRVGYGTAFNNPNYLHFYLNLVQSLVPSGIGALQGNTNIKAEKIKYLDVSNIIQPIDRLRIHADFFYYRLNNLIDPTAFIVPPTTFAAQYQNNGGAEAIGGEIRVEGDIASWLEGYVQWAYEDFDAINGNVNPTPNLGNPKNKVGAGLRGYWFDRRLTANVDFQWTQAHYQQNGGVNFPFIPVERLDDFYLLNIRLAYWPIKDHLELAVAANNVLDDNSPQTPTFDPTFGLVLAERPKFNIWGSIRYVF